MGEKQGICVGDSEVDVTGAVGVGGGTQGHG